MWQTIGKNCTEEFQHCTTDLLDQKHIVAPRHKVQQALQAPTDKHKIWSYTLKTPNHTTVGTSWRQESNVSQDLGSSEQRSDPPSTIPSIFPAPPISGSLLYLYGASAVHVIVSGCYGTGEFVLHLQNSSGKLSHISLATCPWAKLTLPRQVWAMPSGCCKHCDYSKLGLMYKQQHSGQPGWASHLSTARELKEYLSFMNTNLAETRLNSINLFSYIHMGWAKSHLGSAKPPIRPSVVLSAEPFPSQCVCFACRLQKPLLIPSSDVKMMNRDVL